MKNSIFFTLVFMCVFEVTMFGQMPPMDTFPKSKLVATSKIYNLDSVVVRWAPTDPFIWQLAIQSGYSIERVTFQEDKILDVRKLNTQVLKPLPKEVWLEKARGGDTTAAAIAELLYGAAQQDPEFKKGSLDNGISMSRQWENKHGFALFMADLDKNIAQQMGLRWVDKDLQKGRVYLYRIYLENPKTTIKMDTAIAVTDLVFPIEPMRVTKPGLEMSDHAAIFKWPFSKETRQFTALFFERSADAGRTWKQTHELPRAFIFDEKTIIGEPVKATFTDSLPENYRKYLYRIRGIDAFGDQSDWSETFEVMGVDRVAPSQPFDVAAKYLGGTKVEITWKDSLESDFAGYRVQYAFDSGGPFMDLNKELLPAGTTRFVHDSAWLIGTNFYFVVAVDTAGNATQSLPAYAYIKDSIPPSQPLGLRGEVDTLGQVTLHWARPIEEDVIGYMVFRANAADHEFQIVTPDYIIDTTFYDSISLHTLTRHIYYQIVAFDRGRNHSPRSEILELTRPDKIPPVPAVIGDFVVSDSTVWFEWHPSSSADLKNQILMRREGQNGAWKSIATFGEKESSYTDQAVQRNIRYFYTLQSVDETGLRSEFSHPLDVRVLDSGRREPVQNLAAKWDATLRKVVLEWEYPRTDAVFFNVYRQIDDNRLQLIKVVPDRKLFEDSSITQNGKYQYTVKALWSDGGESPVSKPVNVQIK
jgi:uncharacterized protein